MLKIYEIFLSIDGEGSRAGETAIFIRRTKCNLRCSFCDSKYTFTDDDAEDMTPYEILNKCEEIGHGCKRITFTGGEPLLYTSKKQLDEIIELLDILNSHYYEVNIETNGAIDLTEFENHVKPSGFFTMDWKSVSSGMSKYMLGSNLNILDKNDVLKFVVGSQEDLDQMKYLLMTRNLPCQIFVSPVFGAIEPVEIVNYILDNNLHECRVQIQMHKVIWDPNMRGV